MVRRIKNNKQTLIDLIIEYDAAKELAGLFSLYTKIGLGELNEYIKKAKDKINVKSFLLDYKEKQYSREEQEKYEQDKIDMFLGIKNISVSEWRKIYDLKNINDEITITGYKGTETDVVVPGWMGRFRVVCIDCLAFSPNFPNLQTERKMVRNRIKSLVLSEGIKFIEKLAFKECFELETVVLPESIEYINTGAFKACFSLERVTIQSKDTKIAEDAFAKCGYLKIYAPKGSLAEEYARKKCIPFFAI